MSENDRLLGFDAAGSACSAAVWVDGALRARRFEAMSRGQSERLLPLIEEVLSEANIEFADLGALAVTLGPGGFTGVRIGLATARGLALALGLPVIGITSFEAVAAGVAVEERAGRSLLVVIESKRRELFAQALAPDLTSLGAPAVAAPEAMARLLPPGAVTVAGDGVEAAWPALVDSGRDLHRASGSGATDAAAVVRLAAGRPRPPLGQPPRPLYLRGADVSFPKPRSPAALGGR